MQCIQRVMTLKLWFMIKKMKLLKNFLNHFFKGPLHERISMKNLWRISQKFYTILNKFKSVWVCPKLWRTLNNRMTLKVIEIWNLNRFKGTYKHEKIKNQKQRKRESFYVQLMKKSKMQNGYLFRQMQQEKIQHENLVSNDQ